MALVLGPFWSDVGLGDGKPRFQPLFFLGKAAVKIKDIR